jgi:hypothetical protein
MNLKQLYYAKNCVVENVSYFTSLHDIRKTNSSSISQGETGHEIPHHGEISFEEKGNT